MCFFLRVWEEVWIWEVFEDKLFVRWVVFVACFVQALSWKASFSLVPRFDYDFRENMAHKKGLKITVVTSAKDLPTKNGCFFKHFF